MYSVHAAESQYSAVYYISRLMTSAISLHIAMSVLLFSWTRHRKNRSLVLVEHGSCLYITWQANVTKVGSSSLFNLFPLLLWHNSVQRAQDRETEMMGRGGNEHGFNQQEEDIFGTIPKIYRHRDMMMLYNSWAILFFNPINAIQYHK